MRPVLLSILVAGIIGACGAACTAAGSSTIVGGPDGGTPADIEGGTVDTDGGTTGNDGGGTVDYASLFGPPASTNATPNSITGLWAGTDAGGTDTRLVISASSLVIAKKCSSSSSTPPVGITVVSQISSSSIRTLESQMGPNSTGLTCGLDVKPVTLPRCTSLTETDAAIEGQGTTDGCFFLSGTKLNFYSSTLLHLTKLTKLSD